MATKKLDATVNVQSLVFSDSSQIDFADAKLIIFVGPNNAGKSAALKEIQLIAQGEAETKVLKDASISKDGSVAQIKEYIEAEYFYDDSRGSRLYSFLGGQVWTQTIEGFWRGKLGELAPLFFKRMPTDDRLSTSDPVKAVDLRRQVGSSAIHAMQRSDTLEKSVCDEFKNSFDLYLYVDRFGGSEVGLRVGGLVEVQTGEDRISDSYGKRLEEQTKPLKEQGDGMRAFTTVVSGVLAFDSASVLLIDEPEAFLHPPQARLLGEFLSTNVPKRRQAFIATHSPDLLIGAMANSPKDTLVVRIEREGDINHVSQLDNELAEEISKDPVLMHSQVLDGVFHERVFVCEADADNMFFRAILHAIIPSEEKRPDVHFCQSGGKTKMPSIVRALRGLSVRTDTIVDIDALDNAKYFRSLIEAARGTWGDVSTDYNEVVKAIEAQRGITKVRDLQKFYTDKVMHLDGDAKIESEIIREQKNIFRDASPWGLAKRSGVSLLPSGEPQNAFTRLAEKCGLLGIWLVPVGELERFCPSIGGHGPKWAQAVLEQKDIQTDLELEAARTFVTKIWKASWIRNDRQFSGEEPVLNPPSQQTG